MNFDELGLMPRLVAALEQNGITAPTPIQEQAIPHVLDRQDVMGLAQTGTGKTVAFGLPILQQLIKAGIKPAPKAVHGLILAPTRELAKQIKDNLATFTKNSHLKTNLVVGGMSISAQVSKLSRGTDLLIATPGRLLDLVDRGAVNLGETRFLVLDEADQMLDLGFIHALRRIAPLLSPDRQTLLFSATMPKHMAELADTYLTDPKKVSVSKPGQVADKVTQELHFVSGPEKTGLLIELLEKHPDELCIVFARTKHGSERLKKALVAHGFEADSVHGNKSQGQRQRAIVALRSGEVKILVATDVAARGLDIPDVRYVYNYDLPNVPENYVHRIGRTARAGRDGLAIALVAPDEMGNLKDVEKILKAAIPVASGFRWDRGDIEGPSKPRKPQRRRGGAKPAGKDPKAGNGSKAGNGPKKDALKSRSKPPHKAGGKGKPRPAQGKSGRPSNKSGKPRNRGS